MTAATIAPVICLLRRALRQGPGKLPEPRRTDAGCRQCAAGYYDHVQGPSSRCLRCKWPPCSSRGARPFSGPGHTASFLPAYSVYPSYRGSYACAWLKYADPGVRCGSRSEHVPMSRSSPRGRAIAIKDVRPPDLAGLSGKPREQASQRLTPPTAGGPASEGQRRCAPRSWQTSTYSPQFRVRACLSGDRAISLARRRIDDAVGLIGPRSAVALCDRKGRASWRPGTSLHRHRSTNRSTN